MPFEADDTVATFSVLNPITGEYITYDLVDELSINENTIEQDMGEQAAKYAQWSSYLVVAERAVRAAKDNLDVVLAQSENSIRAQYSSTGVKATASQITANVNVDPTVVEAKNKLTEMLGYESALKYILKALDHRKDMLVNLSAQRRKAMELTGVPQRG